MSKVDVSIFFVTWTPYDNIINPIEFHLSHVIYAFGMWLFVCVPCWQIDIYEEMSLVLVWFNLLCKLLHISWLQNMNSVLHFPFNFPCIVHLVLRGHISLEAYHLVQIEFCLGILKSTLWCSWLLNIGAQLVFYTWSTLPHQVPSWIPHLASNNALETLGKGTDSRGRTNWSISFCPSSWQCGCKPRLSGGHLDQLWPSFHSP